MSIDTIAIGGGFAGLIAANRAAQLGRSAVVLEQQDDDRYICNSRITTGVSHILFRDMDLGEDALRPLIERETAGAADADLVKAFAANSRRAIEWLRAEGARFVRVHTSLKFKNLMLAPPRRFKVGLDWEGRGGDVLLRRLEANLAKRGGRLERGVQVASVIVEDGRCVGVRARRGSSDIEMRASAVVIADGGFPANLDMVRRYISTKADRLLVRSAASARGDGLRIAEQAGARLRGFGQFYGHPMHREALHNPTLWPFPMMDPLAQAAIVVGADGRRFTDEGRGGISLANEMAALDDPQSATLIVDDAIWTSVGREVGGAKPLLASAGATVHTAKTVPELAGIAGLPAGPLAETVAAYNAAIGDGRLGLLRPPRSDATFPPLPIVVPPFRAVPLCCGITGTMGGVAIDAGCRALGADGRAIPGLYAAGSTVAGLEGGPNVAYMGGLSKAFILGLLAAESIDQDLAQAPPASRNPP